MRYIEMKFINFRDYTFEHGSHHRFQWIDRRTFTIPNPDVHNDEILSEVVASAEYRDDYVGGGIDASGLRHGPYWVSAITPEAFTLVNESQALEITDRWLSNCVTTPGKLTEEINEVVRDRIRSSDSIFTLNTLPRSAENDYGNIHREFHELIAIDRQRKEASLIVLSDD